MIEVVREHVTRGRALGVRATPTLLFGVRDGTTLRVTGTNTGTLPFAVFSDLVAEAVESSRGLSAK